jgi:hypothetical protein
MKRTPLKLEITDLRRSDQKESLRNMLPVWLEATED